jgi:hypothetical protein
MSMIERRMFAMTREQFYQALSEFASRDLGRPVKVSNLQYPMGVPHFVDLVVEEVVPAQEPVSVPQATQEPAPVTEAAP